MKANKSNPTPNNNCPSGSIPTNDGSGLCCVISPSDSSKNTCCINASTGNVSYCPSDRQVGGNEDCSCCSMSLCNGVCCPSGQNYCNNGVCQNCPSGSSSTTDKTNNGCCVSTNERSTNYCCENLQTKSVTNCAPDMQLFDVNGNCSCCPAGETACCKSVDPSGECEIANVCCKSNETCVWGQCFACPAGTIPTTDGSGPVDDSKEKGCCPYTPNDPSTNYCCKNVQSGDVTYCQPNNQRVDSNGNCICCSMPLCGDVCCPTGQGCNNGVCQNCPSGSAATTDGSNNGCCVTSNVPSENYCCENSQTNSITNCAPDMQLLDGNGNCSCCSAGERACCKSVGPSGECEIANVCCKSNETCLWGQCFACPAGTIPTTDGSGPTDGSGKKGCCPYTPNDPSTNYCCKNAQSGDVTYCQPNKQRVDSKGNCICCSTPLCGDACCSTGEECINGVCCTKAQVCGTNCCATGMACIGTTCCPTAQLYDNNTKCCGTDLCGTNCCAAGEECINGACCPKAQACGTNCCATGMACIGTTCCPTAQLYDNNTKCCGTDLCGTNCCGAGQNCINNKCVTCPSGSDFTTDGSNNGCCVSTSSQTSNYCCKNSKTKSVTNCSPVMQKIDSDGDCTCCPAGQSACCSGEIELGSGCVNPICCNSAEDQVCCNGVCVDNCTGGQATCCGTTCCSDDQFCLNEVCKSCPTGSIHTSDGSGNGCCVSTQDSSTNYCCKNSQTGSVTNCAPNMQLIDLNGNCSCCPAGETACCKSVGPSGECEIANVCCKAGESCIFGSCVSCPKGSIATNDGSGPGGCCASTNDVTTNTCCTLNEGMTYCAQGSQYTQDAKNPTSCKCCPTGQKAVNGKCQ